MRTPEDHLLHGLVVGGSLAMFNLVGAWVSTWGLSAQPADWAREFGKASAYFMAGVAGGVFYSFLTRRSAVPRMGERARAGAIAGAAVGLMAAAIGAALARWPDVGTVLTVVVVVGFSSAAGALLAALKPFSGLPPSR